MTTIAAAPTDVRAGRHFIDGEWTDSQDGRTFEVRYPATGEVLTTCAEGGAAEIDRAVAAARRALPGWAGISPAKRSRLLRRFSRLLQDNADLLAQLTTLEMGKPIRESSSVDLPHAAAVYRYYGEWADKLYSEVCPVDPAFHNFTLREPLGVVGAITAWNFPLVLAAWKLAPALATGNTVVLKPAEQAPLASLELGRLAMEAGFPPGVLNVVAGFGPTAGAALAAHEGVDKIAFTGEHHTARKIMAAAAGNLKKLSLECGGKSPQIVFPDADLEGAVKATFAGIFSNQGQVCNAGSRLFLHRERRDEFLEKLKARVQAIKVGDPTLPETEMGPVVSEAQQRRVRDYVRAGESEGASVLVGNGGLPDRGYYVAPTVFTGVNNTMRIAREEIFGPVLSVLDFESEDDLVAQANDTLYGLAAGLWTNDLTRAHRLARKLAAGTIWINCFNVFDLASPFGGYKISGIGKELGRHALDLYTQTKSVWIKL